MNVEEQQAMYWTFHEAKSEYDNICLGREIFRVRYLFSVATQDNYIVQVSILDSLQLEDEQLSQRL